MVCALHGAEWYGSVDTFLQYITLYTVHCSRSVRSGAHIRNSAYIGFQCSYIPLTVVEFYQVIFVMNSPAYKGAFILRTAHAHEVTRLQMSEQSLVFSQR